LLQVLLPWLLSAVKIPTQMPLRKAGLAGQEALDIAEEDGGVEEEEWEPVAVRRSRRRPPTSRLQQPVAQSSQVSHPPTLPPLIKHPRR
jgi:hypothetical protein